jgi:hypothetical protein
MGDHLEDLGIDWSIILEWIFREAVCETGHENYSCMVTIVNRKFSAGN